MSRALGAEIRRLRLQQPGRMRQTDLARLIGQARHTQIAKYENGTVTPDPDTLAKLAPALGVSVDYFAGFGGAYQAAIPAPVEMIGVDDPMILRLGGPMGYALAVKVAAVICVRRQSADAVMDEIDACLKQLYAARER